MLLITGCTTTKNVYIYPDLNFPDKLTLNTEYDEKTDTVSMSLNEYEKIYFYVIDVETVEKIYNECVKLYSQMNQNQLD